MNQGKTIKLFNAYGTWKCWDKSNDVKMLVVVVGFNVIYELLFCFLALLD